MLICRFADRDGDGLISTEDLFTTQALIAQRSLFLLLVMSSILAQALLGSYRSHSFLRLAFRMYIESIWYPGKQLNVLNLQRNHSVRGGVKSPYKAAPG